MLDKQTTSVLKALNRLANGNAYKVITSEEILSNLNQKSQFDLETIKQSVEFLEKQQYRPLHASLLCTPCLGLRGRGCRILRDGRCVCRECRTDHHRLRHRLSAAGRPGRYRKGACPSGG